MPDDELIARIAESSGLSAGEAARVIGDVLAWHAEPVDAFVRRRHAERQLSGQRNAQIFALLADEVRDRLFAAPQLSPRQLRRIVYG